MSDYFSGKLKPAAVQPKQDVDRGRLIVRVVTSGYSTGSGLAYKRELRFLKRKSSLCMDGMDEDISGFGEKSFIEQIDNFWEVNDGIYQLVRCNFSRDWESGIVDDWDFTLIPWKEEK